MNTPALELATRRAYLAQAEGFPKWNPEYPAPSHCEDHPCTVWCFDEGDDKNVCLECVRWELQSLAEFCGNPGPRPAPKSCPECHDGDPEWMAQNASCTFGCGAKIDHDEGMGFCPTCSDHSANEAECGTCGVTWGDWAYGKGEKVR